MLSDTEQYMLYKSIERSETGKLIYSDRGQKS